MTPNKKTFLVTLIAGCGIMLLTFGPRSSLGLFMEPISSTNQWGREIFALAIAIQNLIWGFTQPFFGALADRFGPARIITLGTILYSSGIAMMSTADSSMTLYFSVGLLAGLGLSGASITIVIAAVAQRVPEEKRSLSLGLITAAGSLGQFSVVPACQSLMLEYGWQIASLFLASLIFIVVFFSLGFRTGKQKVEQPPRTNEIKGVVKIAFGERSYILLVTGFFVCGFHVAFITNHFPAYLTDLGVDSQNAAWAISLIGLFNVFGAYLSGLLGGKYSKRNLLFYLYSLRAIVISLFLLLPLSSLTIAIFSCMMGLLWLSTVPLTSGLVGVMFGTRFLGSLYGFVFLSHQLGAFCGVLMGGKVFEMTGGYQEVWMVAVALSVLAAVLHLPIQERLSPKMRKENISSLN